MHILELDTKSGPDGAVCGPWTTLTRSYSLLGDKVEDMMLDTFAVHVPGEVESQREIGALADHGKISAKLQ